MWPLLQTDNSGHIVAMQNLARDHDLGIAFATMEQLRAELEDADQMARLRASVWGQRERFTFDYHADRLIAFLRQVIERAG
jgi:hypothetical protein